jgi:hypothetical protein
MDLERKKVDKANAEHNRIAQEDFCRARAFMVWERHRTMTRSAMTQDDLKVLIQGMKWGLNSSLRKVSTKGDPLRPVIEAQCQEREVRLVKGKESRSDELTHYNLHVLLELEGVTTLESYLLQQTEEELCSICSIY